MNIFNYIDKILLLNNADKSKIPEELAEIPTETINETDIQVLLDKIFRVQKKAKILAATDDEALKNIILAINNSLNNNKISVVFKGELFTTALEEELRMSIVHTDNGIEFIPMEIKGMNGMYYSEDRILLKRENKNNEKALYTYNGEFWGALADETYCFDEIEGTADACVDKMTVIDKAKLILSIADGEAERCCGLDNIAVFKKESAERLILPLPDTNEDKNFYNVELELFTGLSSTSDNTTIVKAMATSEIPTAVIEDISAVIMSKIQGATTTLPDKKRIVNTMERICML